MQNPAPHPIAVGPTLAELHATAEQVLAAAQAATRALADAIEADPHDPDGDGPLGDAHYHAARIAHWLERTTSDRHSLADAMARHARRLRVEAMETGEVTP